MLSNRYTVCKRCVMDTSDPHISFDENGYCNYCNYAIDTMNSRWMNTPEGEKKLDSIIETIKTKNRSKKYDCMIGLSGGLDSSYLAYILKKKYNLRMLALHVDTGWNTQISEDNIKKICDMMEIDLRIEKLDEHQFMDLQKAYLLSGVESQDIPQDHTFMALLFKYAKENNIDYFMSGANFSSESILQKIEGSVVAADKINVLDIHKHYGSKDIKDIPMISLFDRYIKYRFINKITMIRPLDYLDYRISDAIKELEKNVGFNYYGGKHYESIFTKFYQEYYLPKRLNYDKRKSHLSSLIVTNQITREQAIELLDKPLYKEEQMEREITHIIDKLGITREQFDEIMELPRASSNQFKTSKWNKLRWLAVKYRSFLGE